MRPPLRQLLHLIITSACLAAGERAQAQFSTPPPEIVSAWKHNGGNAILVFGYDGTYYQVQGDVADPGMERGTFQWDKATQAFNVDTIVDTNGESGLSHPAGAASVSIGGTGNNTLNYTVAGEGTFTFSRILNGTLPGNAIVGSWIAPGEKVSITFLADGSYYHAQESNYDPTDEQGTFYTGSERGTYVWTSANGILTATPTSDTNGDSGLSDPQPSFVVSVTGNTMTIVEGADTYTLTRITTNPTPLRLPDFEVIRFANYVQTSNSDPAAAPFDDLNEIYPFEAEAFVEPAVGATAPTIKIGGGEPIALIEEDPGSFEIGEGFASLAALNSFLPASTALQFKSGSALANLTNAAVLSFPSIPKIIVRDNASWSGSVYRFGADEVLQWTLPTGFDATKYLTFVEIYDPVADQDILGAELHGDVTFLDLSGKLDPGKQYEVLLEFYRSDNSTTSGTGVFAGKQGYVRSASTTIFNVRSRDVFPEPPVINAQPVSQPGTANSPMRLTVGINDGAFPFSTFQWSKDGNEIPGQTASSLFIASFNPLIHSGNYQVLVSNSEGDTASISVFVGSAVQFLFITNEKQFRQISPSQFTEGGAKFDARVEGVGITAAFPASSISVRGPDNTSYALALDEDHWDVETDFPSFAAMRNIFPTGTYTMDIGGDSFSIPFTGAAFPNQPAVSSTIGTWVNGKLRLTATEAASSFSISTNNSTGNGWHQIIITDATDTDIVHVIANTQENPSLSAVAQISGGLLSVGQSYEMEASFGNTVERINVSEPSWAAPGAQGYEQLSMATFLTIEVVADSSAGYITWQSGFFTPTQLANPAISGDDADFDNDGIDTLLEFILGGSPTAPNPNLLKNATTTPAPGGRNLVFFYDRKTAANGITQVMETSPSLTGTWTPAIHGVAGVTITTSTLDGQTERVTATIPSTETKLFVRLKAMR